MLDIVEGRNEAWSPKRECQWFVDSLGMEESNLLSSHPAGVDSQVAPPGWRLAFLLGEVGWILVKDLQHSSTGVFLGQG